MQQHQQAELRQLRPPPPPRILVKQFYCSWILEYHCSRKLPPIPLLHHQHHRNWQKLPDTMLLCGLVPQCSCFVILLFLFKLCLAHSLLMLAGVFLTICLLFAVLTTCLMKSRKDPMLFSTGFKVSSEWLQVRKQK